MNNRYRITNRSSSLPNYGFSLNPLDYFDIPNPLEYIPASVLDTLGLDGYASEKRLKDILDKKSDNYSILLDPLYTTRNVFQYWSILYYQLLDQPNFETEKYNKKIEDFADLLKSYSIQEPENVTNFKLLKETNDYLLSLANLILPKEKELNKNIYFDCKSKLDKTGTITPVGKVEEEFYKENRSLVLEINLKRGLIVGIPTVLGMYLLWQKRK